MRNQTAPGDLQLADGSTLFLDEIANISLDQQSTLLRVIETGEFEPLGASQTVRANARIISATNANLRDEVAAGRFRQDLLFRLNTIEIPLPPLRERRGDIEPLATLFLRQHAGRYGKKVIALDPGAHDALLRYAFPGNIRELDHIIERAVLMAHDERVKATDLGLASGPDDSLRIEEMRMEEVESFLIKKALSRFDGNARRAAEALGLSRSTFYRRMQQVRTEGIAPMKPVPADHDATEEAILAAADRLLARDGYRQMTMDDLAREAGIAKAVIYLHFLSKDDVILAHIDRIASAVLEGLQRIAASSAAPAEKLRRMITLRVMQRFDSVQHYPEALSEVIHDLGPVLLQQRDKHFAAEARLFADVLKDADSVFAIPPQERIAVAAAIISATNALLPYNLSAADLGRRREIADRADRIATMLLLGLVRSERGPKRRAA